MDRLVFGRFLGVGDASMVVACGPEEVGDENGDDGDEKHGCNLLERPRRVSCVSLHSWLVMIGHDSPCKRCSLAVYSSRSTGKADMKCPTERVETYCQSLYNT